MPRLLAAALVCAQQSVNKTDTDAYKNSCGLSKSLCKCEKCIASLMIQREGMTTLPVWMVARNSGSWGNHGWINGALIFAPEKLRILHGTSMVGYKFESALLFAPP